VTEGDVRSVPDIRSMLMQRKLWAFGRAFPLFFILSTVSIEAAETIKAGMIDKPNAVGWPWYIGVQKGLFAEAGINLNFIYGSSNYRLAQQLAAGTLDIGVDLSVFDSIYAIEKGAPIRIIRIIGQVSADEMLAKPDGASIKNLKGKTICIGGLMDVNRIYLKRIMKANGLTDGDYEICIVGNGAGRLAALKSGAVNAAILTPPFNFLAKDAGFLNFGRLLDYAGDLPFSAINVSLAYANQHPVTLGKVLAVVDRSVAWFNEVSHREEAIDILIRETKSARDSVEQSYDYLRKIDYFARGNTVSRSRIQNLINEINSLGDVKTTVRPDHVVMPSLARLID
jgi:NitT/TauT family transport system substrate-binding protein